MFWDNFERLCREAGTTPSGACVAVGIGQNRPSNWKKNGTIPKQDELETLAKHLGCTVADFFKDDETRNADRLARLLDMKLSDLDPDRREFAKNYVTMLFDASSSGMKPSMKKVSEGSEGSVYEFKAPVAVPHGAEVPEPSQQPTLDDYELDFIRIYESLDPKTRIRLMNAVYEFDTEGDDK